MKRIEVGNLIIKCLIYTIFLFLCGTIYSKEVITSENKSQLLFGKIICIDPGHGKFSKNFKEKIAPNSNITKAAFVSGAMGTKFSEAEINLMISKKLEIKLMSYGAKVIVTRDNENATMSNIRRAQFANENNANMAIRLHADGSDNKSIRGMSMLIPGNKFIEDKDLLDKSKKLGELVLKHTVNETKAKNRGVVVRNDMTGFNWSEVPVILFEMGFMSNAEDESLLGSSEYQEKIVDGIINGILEYYRIR